MSHRNARTTLHGRLLMVQRHRDGMSQAHIAKAMGVSRKCVATWLTRYAAEGEAGLAERSSRPHSMPTRTSPQLEARIVETRERLRCGPDGIGAELGVPARTVSRVLSRHHCPHLALLDPITGQVIRASKTTAVRYERATAGDLVHMDTKKVAKIPAAGPGWRVTGRAQREATRDRSNHTAAAARPARIEFLHSMVDDHSRFAYCELLADEKGPTCAGFLERGIAALAAVGITRIRQLMTDNAWAYRWSLREVCAAHDIEQIFIKPHCPWQNGKVERLNRTVQTEWIYRRPYTSNEQRTAALAPWLEHYNTDRRHSALAGNPPISRLLPT